jgi:putative protease
LKTAIDFGADAVYLGGNRLNLRAFADNFTDNELTQGIRYAHVRGKKAFITVNVFPHNDDLKGLEDYLKKLYKLDVDGIIVSDPGIIMTARQTVPDLELHLSTQSNSVNWMSALFWYKQGIRRIVLARELSLKEIKEIRQHLPEECEIEAFVHGAMCMSYSGRCMLSNYMTGRDSNRGQCAQPCRYKYYLMEEKRPGEYFPVFEDTEGDYILNSKDLCMIEYIPELVGAGINSFKIEGRMKSAYYVATVVKAYRRAMDAYLENPDKYVFKEKWLKDLMKASHRKYFTGFYFGDKESQIYENSSYIRNYDIVGVVRDYDRDNGIAVVEQRNKVFDGDIVEVLRPEGDGFTICLENMKNEEEENIESAPVAQMIFTASVDRELKKGDMLIKSKNSK